MNNEKSASVSQLVDVKLDGTGTPEYSLKPDLPGATELSLDVCRLYAKRSCRHCHGRGYLTYNNPLMQWADYCSCVKNMLRKIANSVGE